MAPAALAPCAGEGPAGGAARIYWSTDGAAVGVGGGGLWFDGMGTVGEGFFVGNCRGADSADVGAGLVRCADGTAVGAAVGADRRNRPPACTNQHTQAQGGDRTGDAA